MERINLIHIATHGFFLPNPSKNNDTTLLSIQFYLAKNPMLRSGLLLSGAELAWNDKKVYKNRLDVDFFGFVC